MGTSDSNVTNIRHVGKKAQWQSQYFAYLKHRLGCIALNVISVDDNLDYSVPHFFAHKVSGDTNEVQYYVDIPSVIRGILFGQNCYF